MSRRRGDGAFYSYCSTVFIDKSGPTRLIIKLLMVENKSPVLAITGQELDTFCAPRRGEKESLDCT